MAPLGAAPRLGSSPNFFAVAHCVHIVSAENASLRLISGHIDVAAMGEASSHKYIVLVRY